MQNTKTIKNFVLYVAALLLLTIYMVTPINTHPTKEVPKKVISATSHNYLFPVPNVNTVHKEVTVSTKSKDTVTKIDESLYQVTSSALNVRKYPTTKSSVKYLIRKGDTVDVIGKTSDGWLELHDGNFIKSDFVKNIGMPALNIMSLSSRSGRVALPLNDSSTPNGHSNLTEKDISMILKGTALANDGLEESFIDIDQRYDINAFFALAVAQLESGWGTSDLARSKNNLFGLGAVDTDPGGKSFYFNSKSDCVEGFGEVISRYYLDENITSIESIGHKYSPFNSQWGSDVKELMREDYNKVVHNSI